MATPASSQSDHRTIKRSKPPTDIGAHRKTISGDQSTSRCVTDHDTPRLDVKDRHGVGHPSAGGARVVRQQNRI